MTIGFALILFSTGVYPIWGIAADHNYPAVPVLDLAPCPTTFFTVGLLLLAPRHHSRGLLILPAIWSVIGGSAAVLLQTPQGFGLIATGLIVLTLAVRGGFARPPDRPEQK